MQKNESTMASTCPACGGSLLFDPSKGKLKCEFCGSEYTPEEVEEAFRQKEQKAAEGAANGSNVNEEGMKGYTCSTCGAELLAEPNTAVMRCPYCGNETIAPAQFSGDIRPDYLIPFAHTKEQAVQKYHDYYRKRLLLPKSFKTDSHVEEIQGVYVPFWLFNGTVHFDGTYDAVDKTRIDDNYDRVKHYETKRKGSLSYEKVPADASKRMENDLMDSVEPYDFQGLKDFSSVYLPGFMAERFDVEEEENLERVQKRVEETTDAKVKATIKHDAVEHQDVSYSYDRDKTNYALLPVWLLVTNYKEKQYKFAMNGQTGKMTGDLPISLPKFLIITVAVFVGVLLLCSTFLEIGSAVLAAVFVMAILDIIMYASMKPVANATRADEYMKDELKLTLQNERFIREEKRRR